MFFRCGCKSDNIMVSLVGSKFHVRGPGGVLEVYMTEGVRQSFILQTQKNTQAWNFRPKKIPGIKISNPKKYKNTGHTSLKKSSNEYFSDPLIATKTRNEKFARR